MTIDKIKINSFGCHKNLELNLSPGINVIYGDNESGKSTLLAFVRAVLYGFDSRASDNPRKRYMPWDAGSEARFGGELTFSYGDRQYRATALFTQSKRTDIITLYNDITGAVIPIPDGQTIGEYILGLSSSAFDCSIYAPQLKSHGDFSKDKTGLLTARLSAVSNNTTESSSTEADRKLKEAMQKISAPRKESGVLDRLLQKHSALKEALVYVEDREGRLGELSGQLEELIIQESKLDNRRKYYLQFREIKQAFEALDKRRMVKNKHKEITALSEEIEAIKEPLDEDLYDIPVKSSKFLLFLGFFFMLVFGAGIFFSVYTYLDSMALAFIVGSLAATVLSLCGSIICFIKSKKAMVTMAVPEDDLLRLEQLESAFFKGQEELQQMLSGSTMEECEQRWHEATALLESTDLDKTTLSSIHQCSEDVLHEKLDGVTEELMEIRKNISYIQARVDALQDTRPDNNITGELFSSHDIYQTLEQMEKDIGFYREKQEALALARNVLAQSSEELQSTFGPVINTKTQGYLEEISGINRGDLRISSNFDVAIYDSNNMTCHSSEDYRGATEDQIYLAMRCALTSLISAEDGALPLYLDDPFVQYDDNRFALTVQFLEKFVQETKAQILLATCQKRAKENFTSDKFHIL